MNKFNSYSFWLKVGTAAALVLSLAGGLLGLTLDAGAAEQIITAVLGLLLVLQIVIDDRKPPSDCDVTDGDLLDGGLQDGDLPNGNLQDDGLREGELSAL
jgi:uncharacterized membrane protein